MRTKRAAKDNAIDILDDILALDFNNCVITVCLAAVVADKNVPIYEKLQLTDDITNDFRDIVLNIAERLRKERQKNDLVLRNYEAGSKPDKHEIEYLELTDQEPIKDQIAPLSSLANLPISSAEDEFVDYLRFYVIMLQCKGNKPIYFYRLYSQKQELHRSKVIAALFTRGHFDRIREPMFLFDRYVDCISTDDMMYIINVDKFQKIFRYFEMLAKDADKTLKTIKKKIPIANFNEFEEACKGHLQKLSKLKNIAGKPYLAEVTMSDIKKVIKQFKLDIAITEKDGQEMLIFDQSNKWEILRLLDDDYLGSSMTGQHYEVTGKRVYQK